MPSEITPVRNNAPCPNPVRADLKAYADRELALLRRFVVSRHLAVCPDCREELNQMRKITDLFAAASAQTNPNGAFAPHLRSRVLAGLDGSASVSAPPPVGRVAPLWRRRPALVFGGGGGVLAASLAAFFTMNAAPRTPNVQTATANPAAFSAYTQDYDGSGAGEDRAAGAATAASVARPIAVPAAPLHTAAAPRYITGSAPVRARAADGFTANGKVSYAAGAAPRMPRAEPEPEIQKGTAFYYKPKFAAPNTVFAPEVRASEAGGEYERKVHKEASLGLRVGVGGLQSASDKVEELVKSTGGYVASNNLTTDDETNEKSADLTVRVPVQDFDTVMASLAKMGNVVSKQVTGEDITEKTLGANTAEQVLVNEAQDTEAKLARQSMSEKRTGQKEAELRQIRMQLAQTRARLGLLRKMAALSTINVTLTEKPVKKTAIVPSSGFLTGMHETNRAAMQAFQTAVRVPLVLIVWILAFSPIWVPLVLAYRWASLKTLAGRVSPAHSAAPLPRE